MKQTGADEAPVLTKYSPARRFQDPADRPPVGRRPGRQARRFGLSSGVPQTNPAMPPMSADHTHADHRPPTDWKHDGVRVIPGNQLDGNTAQTPGMDRKAAINFARVGAEKLWAGTVHIHPDAKTGAHHHGPLESVIYVVKGRARLRWGEKLEFVAEAGPGDFIYVPPYVPHQEINASPTEVLECVLCRSDGQAVAVNLDIEPAEPPETVLWVDPTHPQGGV